MSKLLINEVPLMCLPSLAVKIGLNEALFIQQLHYWVERSKNSIDGRQLSVQHAHEALKDRIVISGQDKISNNEVNVKKPRKVLLRVESKENMRSQEQQKERSL